VTQAIVFPWCNIVRCGRTKVPTLGLDTAEDAGLLELHP
jgi:hypothetical protein